MRISGVNVVDLPAVHEVIRQAVIHGVPITDCQRPELMQCLDSSLKQWQRWPDHAVHLAAWQDDHIVGVILIKQYWNLANLFVLPAYQGQGVAKALLQQAMILCEPHVPRIRLNSSVNAQGFYRSMGFEQTGECSGAPGGAIPFEYWFDGVRRTGAGQHTQALMS
ncbi:GNAT family N-acetyltransferase [Ferrimonas pelagia]|uniref:N-acetyltransferase domain-containing protein n=1 Tax=Ferrimonas pelagia TaxID=1177826 RepID=A0ABP9ENH2_9GAMM